MEQNEHSPSGLGIDKSTVGHLSEAAQWARFLAIVGFVICGLILLLGIFAGSVFSTFSSQFGDEFRGIDFKSSGLGTLMVVIYAFIALLCFFPYLFLFRFANFMKAAIATGEQENIDKSFKNLKIMFRYVGILTIIILCFYALAFLFGIFAASIM